jgi:hypothetical protein
MDDPLLWFSSSDGCDFAGNIFWRRVQTWRLRFVIKGPPASLRQLRHPYVAVQLQQINEHLVAGDAEV